MKKLWVVTLTTALLLAQPLAEAKRLGGGGSMGRQSSNVTQRQATPPAAPTRQQNAQQQPAQQPGQAANAAAAPAKKPWGAMLGGLAAGLGLAWLANSLGLGEAFGNILLIALVVLAGVVLFRMLRRPRAQTAAAAGTPFAFQTQPPADVDASAPAQYKPEKVGNDASARPWEQFGQSAPGAAGSMIGSAVAGAASTWSVPADFDSRSFLDAAQRNFMMLQAAWDQADIATLRSMMTDEMLREVQQQLAEREAEANGAPNITHIEGLRAQLLGIEEQADGYLASVEFSGMSREELGAGLSPFREVWNMSKSKHGNGGWLVAGLQALA
jgi:predicted lipid-binding transport protein (Tim44 family)